MKNFDFGIRVEMGGNIGSGHIFRCIALAEEIKKNKKSIVFLSSNKKNFLIHSKKFPHIELKGRNETERIQECKKYMNIVKCLIIDLPKYEEKYSKKLKKENVIIINDLGNIKIFSKMLINGSIVKKFQKYEIKKKMTRVLAGPKYMLIRKEFAELRIKNKKINKSIKKILLVFGGSDEKNITKKILKFLPSKNLQITILLGPGNKNKKNIAQFRKINNVKVLENPKNIASLFLKQDLIISSTGITIYELACLGIPTIMIPANSAQMESAKSMKRSGFGEIVKLATINDKKFNQIYQKMESTIYREKMARNGKKIVDGKAVERILRILKTEKVLFKQIC